MTGIEKVRLIQLQESGDWQGVLPLLLEYAKSLDIDLSFQNFEQELQNLPDIYGLPAGGLILALVGEFSVGCVAFRRLAEDTAELKRLYVRETFRGMGIAKALVREALDCAAKRGYDLIRLDTLSQMKAAQQLYLSMGFYDIPPYTYNPMPEARFMELKLRGQ